MPPSRPALSAKTVTSIALTVVDEQGPTALTLKAVAERAKVATPSLYNHVAGLQELRSLAILSVMRQLTDALAESAIGLARDDAVRALLNAYRDFATSYPNRYALLEPDPLSNEAFQAEGRRQLEVVARVLAGYGLEGSTLIHAIRQLRVLAHGFASLETAGGFGLAENTDETHRQLSDMLIHQLNSIATQGSST